MMAWTAGLEIGERDAEIKDFLEQPASAALCSAIKYFVVNGAMPALENGNWSKIFALGEYNVFQRR
jgi:hypothetical protein